jgi:integrase
VIYRRAIEDGDLAVNPTSNLRLPAVRGRRERIASPEEAQQLLAALPERDRALWATALYAGLRRGELMALRWEDVDLAQGVIHVERSYDDKARLEIEPKSRAGTRTVPIVGALRDELLAHKARARRESGLVFGSSEEKPFVTSNVWRRAQVAGVAPVWPPGTSRTPPTRPDSHGETDMHHFDAGLGGRSIGTFSRFRTISIEGGRA